MNNQRKLNLELLGNYSRSFAHSQVVEGKSVDGAELLNLTSVEQVNLLMVKNLYVKWEEEIDRLKSPYFNYEAEEVQQSLKGLMNVLSRHILIDPESLKPLVEQAVSHALILSADPRIFFLEHFIPADKETISLGYLEKVQKFVKVNHQVLTRLLDYLKKENKSEVTRTDYVDRIKIIVAELKDSLDPIESMSDQLSQVVKLDPDSIFEGTDAARALANKEETVKENSTYGPGLSLNQQFIKKPTLNDRLNSTAKKTLADMHQNQKLSNLKESLTLNQQFRFTRELFGGDDSAFNQALTQLESCSTYDEAVGVLKNTYSQNHYWDMESDSVKNFLDLLQRRY